MKNYKMWIGGKWMDANSQKIFSVINPANGERFAQVSLGGEAEVNIAVEAARRAFPIWSKKTGEERARALYRIASLIESHGSELALVECLDHGCPINIANDNVVSTIEKFRFGAELIASIMGNQIMSPTALSYIKREPVGVCALIIPWNWPLACTIGALVPALAAGNTCIIKPASIDSLPALELAKIIEKADLPPGTVNIVTGPGGKTGEALASHEGVDLISFVGSTETGKRILSSASRTVKRTIMELGGKNPVLVLEDADIDSAVASISSSQYANVGQTCAAPGRIYVHEKVHDEFVDKFIAVSGRIKVGDPTDEATQMGPLVGSRHRDYVEELIRIGIEEGATLSLGGNRPEKPQLSKGFYVLPTIFTGVTHDMRIAREEIFGPVACIIKVKSGEDMIRLANDTRYGLCASIWTRDITKAIRMTEEIEAGTVWVNAHRLYPKEMPWGGYKESGFGKSFVNLFAIECYTQQKVVTIGL